ncbi:MAG: hypothetical protein HYX90_09930, partial [Chloroflexi bacterium]|nr:hypothetical protein [Chloroflexota bacterium]
MGFSQLEAQDIKTEPAARKIFFEEPQADVEHELVPRLGEQIGPSRARQSPLPDMRSTSIGNVEDLIEEDVPFKDHGQLADPIKMYLQQVGKVRLLTAREEGSIARRVEAGRHLNRLMNEFRAGSGRTPSAFELTAVVLQRLFKASALIETLKARFGLSQDMGWSDLLRRCSEAEAEDSSLSENLARELAGRICASNNIEQECLDLWADIRVLPPEIYGMCAPTWS